MMRKTLREFYYVIGVGTVPAKTDSIIEMCAMQKSHIFRFIHFSCPKNLLFKKSFAWAIKSDTTTRNNNRH